MADHLFLHGKKHLPVRAASIALRHGAELVNHTDPSTQERSHWFVARGSNPEACAAIEAAVKAELLAAGIRVDRSH